MITKTAAFVLMATIPALSGSLDNFPNQVNGMSGGLSAVYSADRLLAAHQTRADLQAADLHQMYGSADFDPVAGIVYEPVDGDFEQ